MTHGATPWLTAILPPRLYSVELNLLVTGAAAVGRGFGAAATMEMERFFEAGEGAKAV